MDQPITPDAFVGNHSGYHLVCIDLHLRERWKLLISGKNSFGIST